MKIMKSESMRILPCHANIIQRKVKVFNKAAARPLRFWEARIMFQLLHSSARVAR